MFGQVSRRDWLASTRERQWRVDARSNERGPVILRVMSHSFCDRNLRGKWGINQILDLVKRTDAMSCAST